MFCFIESPGDDVWGINKSMHWLRRDMTLALCEFRLDQSKFGIGPDLQFLKVLFLQARVTARFKEP